MPNFLPATENGQPILRVRGSGLGVVYGIHPGDGNYFYVGISTNLKNRIYNHRQSTYDPKTPVATRMAEVGFDSVKFEILDEADSESDLRMLERLWIERLRGEGFDLLNRSEGGEAFMRADKARGKFAARVGERNHRWGKPISRNQRARLADYNAGRPEDVVRGENNPKAKLTEDDVRAIRFAHSLGGVSYSGLAAEYGVSKSAIAFIVTRKSWSHVG